MELKNPVLDIMFSLFIEQPSEDASGQLEMGGSWREERGDWGWRWNIWSHQQLGSREVT